MSTETLKDTIPPASTTPLGTPPPPEAWERRSASASPQSGAEAARSQAITDECENSIAEDTPELKQEPVETTITSNLEDPPTPLSESQAGHEEEAPTPAAAPVRKPTTRTTRARIKDLETNITKLQAQRRDMLEDIDLYKLDIVGFRKDIARRDAIIVELQQHCVPPSPEIDSLHAAHARIVEELKLHKQNANAVVAERDAEIARLETVVSGLKMSISTNTRVGEATGDEVFRDTWGRIGYDVMNWCLTNGAVKGGRVDVDKLEEGLREELCRAVPEHERLIRQGHRVHVVQSLVAAILVREVFSGWFLGLEPERDEALRGLEKDLEQTSTPTALNSWRSTTFTLLRAHLLSTPTSLTNLTTHITTTLLNLTTPFLSTPPTPARDKSLTSIVDSTIRIATLMRCQRASFRIATAHAGENWDPETMEDLTGEDEEGSMVGCTAWPGIEKWGDEMGERGEVGRCVVRARVVCIMSDEE